MSGFLFALILLTACLFALSNGFIDGGGMVSTIFPNRSIDPWVALSVIAVGEILGILVLGQRVVDTFAHRVVFFSEIGEAQRVLCVICATLAAALIWNVGMWWLSFPSSSGHALLGALIGSVWALHGLGAFSKAVLPPILMWLLLAPVLAVAVSYVLVKIFYFGAKYLTTRWWPTFRWVQTIALGLVAMVHGSNDGQKTVALVLVAAIFLNGKGMEARGLISAENGWHVGWPLLMLFGGLIAVGAFVGAWRMQAKLGAKFIRLHAPQALCAEWTAALCVGASCHYGFPMSTSQVITNAIVGSGLALHPKKIRWSYFSDMLLVWVTTLPAAGLLGAIFAKGLFYVVS